MVEYIELDITFIRQPEPEYELLMALLSQFGFDGFREEKGRLLAYIPMDAYAESDFQAFMDRHGWSEKIESLEVMTLPDKNWNEIWESEYQPVRVGSNCFVRAPFHPAQDGMAYDIVISPKMSFQTI